MRPRLPSPETALPETAAHLSPDVTQSLFSRVRLLGVRARHGALR
ncbi:hypothetical protein [Streptomyces sp. NPDC057002]